MNIGIHKRAANAAVRVLVLLCSCIALSLAVRCFQLNAKRFVSQDSRADSGGSRAPIPSPQQVRGRAAQMIVGCILM